MNKNFCLTLLFFQICANAETLHVPPYTITAEVVKDALPIKVMYKSIVKQSISAETANKPEIKKFESFNSGKDTYILLDYKIGFEFGSQFEKTCFKAILWKLEQPGKLKVKAQTKYTCEVNSSNEELKAQEFYYPYKLNKEKAEFEYLKQ